MKTNSAIKKKLQANFMSRGFAFLVGALAGLSSMSASSVEIAQAPLYIGSEVPGNLALVPSVEYPTIDSQANIGNYDNSRNYMGYFDAKKCYGYNYDSDESKRYFYPVKVVNGRDCTGDGLWSGNYLSWVATQTIDPFRLALTGGDRVKDTVDETWLQKARHDGQGEYKDRRLPGSGDNAALVKQVTASNWKNITVRIQGLGNKMNFTNTGTVNSGTVVDYNPSKHLLNDSDSKVVYQVSVRVKVCVAGMLEDNCVKYSGGYKPEGLVQEYSQKIRFSIFGYLNDSTTARDGGVMRARQKFVGPNSHYPELGVVANSAAEWNPVTGQLIDNPDGVDAKNTDAAVVNSGVINYLNKFGRMTPKVPKSYDPVSELYYAAIRYFKNLGNVSQYSNMTGSADAKYQLADGFPVITAWDDPIRYSCQVNAILGIGDVNTHVDGNLPGSTYRGNEPATPALVAADKTVDVSVMTNKVFVMEGINKKASDQFTGRNNTAYIAGLAYDSHTRDIRPDDAAVPQTKGKQTVSTYWVDVRENQVLLGKASNQYWLAAKYGGFNVPAGFDPDTRTAALPDSLWTTTGDVLSTGDKRPDNFYVASEADKMVESLTLAFKNIIQEMQGSGSSFASNTTKLEAGAMTYQAQFYGGSWGGELTGYNVNVSTDDKAPALTAAWSATSQFPLWGPLNSTVVGGKAARKIFFANGASLNSFEAGKLGGTPLASASADEINYLRGDRSKEAPAGKFRARRSVLGDIVNSQPVYVGTPNSRLYLGQSFSGASTYASFVAANTSSSRIPVVYVGANDGMLHAFNANTGAEVFAFVPTASMGKLIGAKGYTDPDYPHSYTVDGDLTVADVYTGGSWKTVLVGSLGRGGRGLFALNVTNPTAPSLLWEKSATDIPALGNNLGQPIIAQLADGDWRVLVGNGPNSTGQRAQLVMVSLTNGAVSTIDTGVGSDNGLSGINAWSSNNSGFVDTVYAGDNLGNMWKFTGLTGAGASQKLFAAGASQPITATPLVAKNPATAETWVFFGTGRYLSSADIASKAVQSWYGIIDKGALPVSKANLRSTAILAEGSVKGVNARALESYATAGLNGWYLDLVSPGTGGQRGERMVEPNFFQGLALIGTTRIPDSNDVCSPSGTGFTMAISPFTGGRLAQTFFDVNGDGAFNSGDTLNGVPVSGIGYDSSPNNPIFLGDTMYTGLDDGSSKVIKTNASSMNVRRVSWRELIRE
ncbi:PilC/PilY family type IV pilus protein [Stenotrophomonas sp. YIM B06876]|uniref:pilus assembly protein n=1 Tax=Stenotrophomonas sp. YIM B06876 TaxID=3060211 RepID=UPI00273868A8|nr:PilC/PilY family type IV pilus protein [Stenotrophomonas sp. YIM B06876]